MPGRYNWSPSNCTREVKFDSFDGPDCICFFLRRYDGTTGRGITTARSAITAPPFFDLLLLMPLQRVSKMCITPPTDCIVCTVCRININLIIPESLLYRESYLIWFITSILNIWILKANFPLLNWMVFDLIQILLLNRIFNVHDQ